MWLLKGFFLILLGCVPANTDVKKSLTFVIDDTGSMTNDIDEVKKNTDLVFDTVLNSNETQIDNFILVTFNDPTYKVVTITKDRATFKKALASIRVDGGGDCAEYSMSGIEKALEVSHPSSYIYVFTDATSKDYEKREKVQSMAVKLQSQVVFLLTGDCHKAKTDPEYAAYYTLSKATDGKVFQMEKSNVGQVLKFISNTIESKSTTLVDKQLPPGRSHITYEVDSTVKDTTIVLAGDKGKKIDVSVYKPNGTIADTEIIVAIPGNKIVKVSTPESGNYSAVVDSDAGSSLSITAKSEFDFRHGFSIMRPSSLNATSTRPIAGLNSHILIQLETPDDNIKLKSIDVVDLYNNLIMEFDAKILDDTTKTYFAARFVPPTSQFKLAINTQNRRTGETIRRYSKPIEPQKPELVTALPTSPTIEILEGVEVTASYREPLDLICKVHGYPEPTVFWENTATGEKLNSSFSMVEPPYDYVSVLMLPAVETSERYRCTANNGVTATKDVDVTLKHDFKVIEPPQAHYEIPYNQEATVPCKVNAYPPAVFAWYFDGKVLTSSKDIVVSDEQLTIKHMLPGMEGRYTCDVNNNINRTVADFDIRITGLERPVISNGVTKVSVLQGSDATLTCRILAGKPTPKMSWIPVRRRFVGDFELHDSNMSITLKNVKPEYSNTFMCEASNVAGRDRRYISLNVQYPPKIKREKLIVTVRDGASQLLHCVVKGNPRPHVIWTFNGKIVVPDSDHHIYRDNSLKIKGARENNGVYTCEARNTHGTASQSIDVKFVVPVSIQIPDRSTIDTRVGRDINLACLANGYPEPTIEWTFRSTDSTISPKTFRADASGSLSLRNLQLNADGYYTCNASNIDGATNITYQVNVNGPPEIVNVDKSPIYRAVEGDMVLRVPCKATGRPKPVITWSFQGFNIAKGTEWYDIEDDGTLLIKNVDLNYRGYHLCNATNHLGSDQKHFYVDINRSPYEESPTSFVAVNQSERALVNCPLPQEIGSKLRWFKNDVLISEGTLVIESAVAKDSGVYTCRVSNFDGSKSASVVVIVTSAPEFQTEPETTVEFNEGSNIELDCTSYAEPAAKTEWFYEGKPIDTDSETHYFQMEYSNTGEYTCVVSNEVGRISRTFVLKPQGCALHILDDFTGNVPLITVPYDLSVKITGNYMYVPKNNILKLSCPGGFNRVPNSEISATCKDKSDFIVDRNVYKFSDLKCATPSIPTVIRTGFICSHVDTETVQVGFVIGGKFTPVYEVCVDKRKNIPVFTKLSLPRTGATVDPKDHTWFDNEMVPFDFETMYQCDRQTVEISWKLNKYFHARDKCCFGKRQLVSPKDVIPGLSQVATYSNLNVVPQWGTCNIENWNAMEDRVRSIANATPHKLLVWTGQAGQLTLPDSSRYEVNVTITDGSKQQVVPEFLWKVIQDPAARSSVAIVQVNIPDLTLEEARRHVLCRDVCDKIHWMAGGSWTDVTKGYTYCCRIREFENAFGFRNKFSRGGNNLLSDVSYISTHSLT